MSKSLATWATRNDLSIYLRNAGPTISGLMSKAAEMSGRRISLDDEIDVMRSLVMRAISYWNAALENKDAVSDPDALALQCERLVQDSVDAVVRTVQAAAKVRLMDEGAIQLSSVSWVIGEVTKIIDQEIREQSPELAERIVEKIGEVKLPVDGTLDKFLKKAADEAFL